MDAILATRNPSKIEQIRAVFEGSSIHLLSLDDAGIPGSAVEDGATIYANALKKVQYVQKHCNEPTCAIADDTGLFIHALNGAPGAHATRWAGESATTADITRHTLRKLVGVEDRRAIFETVAVVLLPDGSTHFFRALLKGFILMAERVPSQPKMPYSGIFIPDSDIRVLAEMPVEEENRISHRGLAFTKARAFLERYIERGLV